MSSELLPLDDAIAQLERAAQLFQGTADHALPDVVLHALALDVFEQAQATKLLAASAFPRTASGPARSALEAAMDTVYLTANEQAFDDRGSRCRSYELLKLEKSHDRRARVDRDLKLDPVDRGKYADDTMSDDATRWDVGAPGKGLVLRRAFENAQREDVTRLHWSGLTSSKLREAVEQEIEGESKDILGLLYASLSLHTHPGPRTGVREIIHDDSDSVIMTTNLSSVDPKPAMRMAAMACQFAVHALTTRRAFADGADAYKAGTP